ncbi:MAG: hypothetical protein QOE11_673 [Solirubrobacteraceae bacterium]|nr:hypothetical protein [Solirubrobacteraceae bacterium]
MERLRYLFALGCACAASTSLIACGDSKDENGAAATTTAAPETVFAPDAKVAAGLKDLAQVAVAVSTQTDPTASKKTAEGLEGHWAPVEGTVKRNEPDMYATIEEDLSLLESGDAAKTKTGAAEIGRTVHAYIAKHPG